MCGLNPWNPGCAAICEKENGRVGEWEIALQNEFRHCP